MKNENKPLLLVAPKLNKISDIIDIDGNKLDAIKGHIIEYKKEFKMSDLDKEEPKEEVKSGSLAEKIEKKINDKINEMLDKKIDEIFSKMF